MTHLTWIPVVWISTIWWSVLDCRKTVLFLSLGLGTRGYACLLWPLSHSVQKNNADERDHRWGLQGGNDAINLQKVTWNWEVEFFRFHEKKQNPLRLSGKWLIRTQFYSYSQQNNQKVNAKLSMVVHTFSPSTREAEAGRSRVWGHPGLQSKFQANQGYKEKPCLNKTKLNKMIRFLCRYMYVLWCMCGGYRTTHGSHFLTLPVRLSGNCLYLTGWPILPQ